MDYELGESLQDILNRRKILDEEDIGTVILPIIDGMKQVHAHGFIHRDIKPANIFIRVDGDPVLLDFGSARQAMSEQQQSLTSIFSKGYAPIEQYNTEDEQQGAWTDIYAFGATMYRAIAGLIWPPAPPMERLNPFHNRIMNPTCGVWIASLKRPAPWGCSINASKMCSVSI